MSIFGSILSKIFSHPAAAATTATAVTAAPDAPEVGAPAPTTSVPAPAPAPDSAPDSDPDPATAAVPGPAGTPPVQRVDVAAVLSDLASRNSQSLNWKSSIVDLMKLLDLDSSLHARTELAGELHYAGDTSDTAAMNLWLHQEVMRQLEANGGKVPADLKN